MLCMQGPCCFYLNNFRATTITIATTTNNALDQQEPAEKGAECQVSDHRSIGIGCAKVCRVRGGGVLVVDAHAPVECVGWDTYS